VTALDARIREIVEPSLADMGYALVRVLVAGKHRAQVQIMAERRDGAAMTVDDCAAISRRVSALLDVEDPIEAAYTLEVSSPGIDRPLVRPEDYARFAGHVARLETRAAIDGRRRFQGRLIGLADRAVRIEVDGRELALPLDEIDRGKLVLTDELIAARTAGG
jgi:ribosome maturation factor RimP